MKRASAVAIIFMLILTTLAGALHVRAVSKTIVVPDDYPTITAAVGNPRKAETVADNLISPT